MNNTWTDDIDQVSSHYNPSKKNSVINEYSKKRKTINKKLN